MNLHKYFARKRATSVQIGSVAEVDQLSLQSYAGGREYDGEVRFTPERRVLNRSLSVWERPPARKLNSEVIPTRPSAIPRNLGGRKWKVYYNRQLLWTILAPNFSSAQSEAARLCSVSGYDFRCIRVSGWV